MPTSIDSKTFVTPSNTSLVIGLATAAALQTTGAIADTAPPHGTLAAAIRSAGQPCAQVIEVKPAGDNSWSVRCNAGTYTVIRDAKGKLTPAR